MKDNGIKWIENGFLSFGVALLVAAFSQSCDVTKASIKRQINTSYTSPVTDTFKKTIKKDTVVSSTKTIKLRDTSIVLYTPRKIIDTIYRPSLSNDRLSLENQQKIIDLLVAKDNEVKGLHASLSKLHAVSRVTKVEKIDAVSMEAVWRMGVYILTASCVIIVLLIIVVVIIGNRKRVKNEFQPA